MEPEGIQLVEITNKVLNNEFIHMRMSEYVPLASKFGSPQVKIQRMHSTEIIKPFKWSRTIIDK